MKLMREIISNYLIYEKTIDYHYIQVIQSLIYKFTDQACPTHISKSYYKISIQFFIRNNFVLITTLYTLYSHLHYKNKIGR